MLCRALYHTNLNLMFSVYLTFFSFFSSFSFFLFFLILFTKARFTDDHACFSIKFCFHRCVSFSLTCSLVSCPCVYVCFLVVHAKWFDGADNLQISDLSTLHETRAKSKLSRTEASLDRALINFIIAFNKG